MFKRSAWLSSCKQNWDFTIPALSNWSYKGPGKRGHIVAHDVSWAAQTGKHLYQKHFFVSRTQNLCRQQMLRARANWKTFVSATMCLQQSVLVCHGLKQRYFFLQDFNGEKAKATRRKLANLSVI